MTHTLNTLTLPALVSRSCTRTADAALTSLRLDVIHALSMAAGAACRLSSTGRDVMQLAVRCTDRVEHLAARTTCVADPLIQLACMRDDLQWLRRMQASVRALLDVDGLPFRAVEDERLVELQGLLAYCFEHYLTPAAQATA